MLAMKPVVVLLLVGLAFASVGAQFYYQALIDYLENRLLAIEMLDFRKLTAERVDGASKEHAYLRRDLSADGGRVARVERELDHLERERAPRACVRAADKVLEHGSRSTGVATGTMEMEAGGEWEEVRSEVSDCVDLISSIRSVKILMRVGGPKGTWLRDPGSSKVYVFNGTTGDTVRQFDSLQELYASSGLNRTTGGGGGRDIRLPSSWSGPAAGTVYNDFLYYVRRGADPRVLEVVKYDLLAGRESDAGAMLPVDGPAPVYTLNPEASAAGDLSADGQALWLLYATGEDEPNVHLAQMDPHTLDIERTWDTRCPRQNAEAAFVACGTAYVVYNTQPPSRPRVQCLFDVNGVALAEEAPLIYFPRRFGAHASLKYNAEERQASTAWDGRAYHILYRLQTTKREACCPAP
ncbi:hypothetical protein CRUP_029248, partial [Coryphaenoides rupestris]